MKTIFTFLTLIGCMSIQAQDDSLSVDVDEILIQDKRLEIGYAESSRTINIIDRKAIETAPVQSVAELLQYVAGVDIRRRGIHGIQADISLRGGTFDQVLVMVNGVNMSDPQTGHHTMNLPVDLEQIERIEVLKGPAARRYGQNAFAGAINIVTKKGREQSINLSTQYSKHASGRIAANATLPAGNANHSIGFSKTFSEGYRFNTDYTLDNFFYQSDIAIGDNNLLLNAAYTGRTFGANGFYASPDFTEQYEEIGTSIVSAQYRINKGNLKITPSVFWRRNQDEYHFIRSNPSIFRNFHIGNTYGGEINGSYINALGVLGVGVDFRYDDLASNNLGERTRTTLGFNMEQRFSLLEGKLDVTPGFAAYRYTDFGAKIFPGLDLGYAINGEFKVYGNVGSTWRVPTYTDLFYEDRANLGNPDLEPETALTTEVGVKYNNRKVDIQISGFRRNSTNLIDWSKENEDDKWFPNNIGEVVVTGVELNSNFKINERVSLTANYTRLDGENNVDASISRYALDLISNHVTAGAQIGLSDLFRSSIYVRYVDRLNLDNYNVVDARVGYYGKQMQVSLFASNLFDASFTETNLVPMPGRWMGITVGYTYR